MPLTNYHVFTRKSSIKHNIHYLSMSKNSQSRNDLTFEIMNGHKIPTDEETLEALSIFR